MNTICSFLLIIIFALGFFRMRDVLTDKSTEEFKRTQNKVVFLLIDAFRIDFLMSENFTFFQEKQNSSLIFLAIADTPSVTTQRIEAINTGNIPSFIKFGSAFSAKQIKEDNLLYQAKRAGLSTSFLGDDTWISLFPNTLDIQYPSQSFDATDINTNDNIVINNIEKILGENQTDLLIAHFLGIDHSGHLANDSNIYLWDKERQYSKVFQKVYDKMSDDSILIIMGDHGMTKVGNHGGASQQEVEVGLFITAKNGLKAQTLIQADKFFNQEQSLIPREQFIRKVYQIDIVPTIASLLGISIPFSNIGSIIPEIQNDLFQCKTNLYQVWNFVQKIQNSGFKYDTYQFSQWKEKLNQVETCQDVVSLIYEIQNVSRKVWNEYDFVKIQMSIFGLILIFANLVFEGLRISPKQNFTSFIKYYEIVFLLVVLVHCLISGSFGNFMSLLGLYIIKIQLQQLYQNIRHMNFFIFYPTELTTFIPYVVLIVDLIVFLLSSDYQIKCQQAILGMMFKQAIIIVISQFQLSKKYLFLVINYLTILLVQVYLDQYNQSSAYYESESVLRFNINLNNFYFKYLIPGIFITFYVGSKQQDSKRFILQLAMFFLNFYYFNQGLHSQQNFLNKYLSPILVYVIQSMLVLIDFKFTSLKIIPIVVLVSGQNSLAVFGSLFLSLELFLSNICKLQSELSKGKFTHLNSLFITHIIFYHWYSLGYRQYFSSIQFENAYIGLPQYNFYGTGIILLISLAGIFVVSIFLVNDLMNQHNRHIEQIQQNTLISKIFLIHVTFTCLHCYLNIDSEVIYKIYAPKFVYDSLTYLIIVISQKIISFQKIKTNLK